MEMIIFWCEFPEEVNWKKVNKDIDFDTEIYFACKNKDEFLGLKKKIMNKHIVVGVWPVLDKKDGYWFSGQISKECIDRLDEFSDIKIKVDIEPRIYKGKYGFWKTAIWMKKWILNPGKNKDYLVDKLNILNADKIISGFLLPRWIRKRVGMETKGRKNFICYSSVGGKLAFSYYKFMIKRMDKDNFYALGLTKHGIFGNEPVYRRKEEFIRDFETMKKLGVKNIVIYSLEGILNRDWLDVVREYKRYF